jgi:hypothetical protein
MSGLETAAGAFAVVGVADVLVRTGRELYNFLCDIADAPDDIKRLRELIKETVLLHQTSKKCQDDLQTRSASSTVTGAVRLLGSATKALDRELQSLKFLIAKFKGGRTWSRVKYVLSEAKMNKAIGRLEHAKVLLANALTLACRYVPVLKVHSWLFCIFGGRSCIHCFLRFSSSKLMSNF